MSKNILITGSNGQIGTALYNTFKHKFPQSKIIATDISPSKGQDFFEHLDILDKDTLYIIVEKYNIDEIYHLAAILSAKGEEKPLMAWDINMLGLFNVLEAAKDLKVKKVFYPSSIAVFGKDVARQTAFQNSPKNPESVYGISKVAGENWCRYYFNRYGVDVRSLRFPGIISYESLPGGGTTDYAVEIFYDAIKSNAYTSFLNKESTLPMIYMEDAINAIITLMNCPAESITERGSYNLRGISFSPAEIVDEIHKHLPHFKAHYKPDFRQAISDSWPAEMNDESFRVDTQYTHKYDLAFIVQDMLNHLDKKATTTL